VEGRVAFAEFILDFDTHELARRGTAVALSPKAFHLLSLLVEHRPKAMSKRELQEQLWPGTFVVDKNLTNLVAEIRDALDDDAGDPRFVRTVPRFGYAFQAPPTASLDDTHPAGFRVVWPAGHAALRDGDHVIGRDPDLELFLDDVSVSRRHARITIAGERATVEDLASKNGTFVGERRVESATPLADGDVIRVGSVTLKFYTVQAVGSTETRST
jgi:DNA-binding winged helix-turn-helix (wHTH) protein